MVSVYAFQQQASSTEITKVERKPRRSVTLSGFAALEDGSTFAITVLDLSYDGCRIQTAIALLPGVRLKVAVLGSGSLDARVRWYADGFAGLQFKAETEAEVLAKRSEVRNAVAARASLRRSGRPHKQCEVYDLTSTGCKCEFAERPLVGELLWAKFDRLEPMEAKVRWISGACCGLEFVRPIHPAVFELLLARLQT